MLTLIHDDLGMTGWSRLLYVSTMLATCVTDCSVLGGQNSVCRSCSRLSSDNGSPANRQHHRHSGGMGRRDMTTRL